MSGAAYLRAATSATAVNGFRKCGISPYNPDIFTDGDFAPAETTDRPEPSVATDSEDQAGPSVWTSSIWPTASPEEVIAVPELKETNEQRRGRKKGTTVILTSSPYKRSLSDTPSTKAVKKKSRRMDIQGTRVTIKRRPQQKSIANEENSRDSDTGVDDICLYCSEGYNSSR